MMKKENIGYVLRLIFALGIIVYIIIYNRLGLLSDTVAIFCVLVAVLCIIADTGFVLLDFLPKIERVRE